MVASIQDAGQKINENVLSELNEVTDTVNQMCSDNSAISQQLAAGMQETAATTVTINENVSQIKGEAENINAMAEEGAKNCQYQCDCKRSKRGSRQYVGMSGRDNRVP